MLKELATTLGLTVRNAFKNFWETKRSNYCHNKKYFSELFGVQRIGGIIDLGNGNYKTIVGEDIYLSTLVRNTLSFCASLKSI